MQLADYLDFISPDVIRLKGQHIGLEQIIARYHLGADPEQIALDVPGVPLDAIYGSIAYYLRHRSEVEQYLARRGHLNEQRVRMCSDAEEEPDHEVADCALHLCLKRPGLVGHVATLFHIQHLEHVFQAMRDHGWVVDIPVAKRLLYQVDTLLAKGAITPEAHHAVVTQYDLERVRQFQIPIPD
jgi:uncharacterized protein (DUF433 family)